MNNTQPVAARSTQWEWPVFTVLTGWLVWSFLWRMTVTANEMPMRRMQVLTMVLDGLLIVGMSATWRSIVVPDDAEGLKHVQYGLLLVGLLAGVGLFAIRMTSTYAWWTGHLQYIYD